MLYPLINVGIFNISHLLHKRIIAGTQRMPAVMPNCTHLTPDEISLLFRQLFFSQVVAGKTRRGAI